MKVEVKLYSYHDMDLVGLYKTGKVSFPETTRQVLNSYARGEVYGSERESAKIEARKNARIGNAEKSKLKDVKTTDKDKDDIPENRV